MNIFTISQINLLIWVLFGLVIGSVVHLFDPGEVKGGIFATLGLGILGAVLGGLAATFVYQKVISGINFQYFAITIITSLVVAVIYRLIFRDRNHIRTINMKL